MARTKLAIDTEFSDFLRKYSKDLVLMRQNWLLSESQFLSFAGGLGLTAFGAVAREPGVLHRLGLLSADGRLGTDLLFHRFRIYTLHELLSGDPAVDAVRAKVLNEVVDLAILLEPLYWPHITGHTTMPPGSVEHEKRWTKYWTGVKNLLDGRDVLAWERLHASIRQRGARLDDNPELYLLLRLSSWERRKELTGRIGGALWIRHIAEVIRMGFEEFHQVRWLEEDRAFGRWSPGARARIFGAERPLDDTLAAKPYLAARFGLSTRSTVRWYLEGHTEYYAAAFALNAQLAAQEPAKLGIELINLCGQIASGKKNAPLKLEQSLKEDLTMKRFSILSFDLDVIENQKFVRRQIENNTIVGLINANKPDFEFANFSIEELIEVAALMDDRAGFDGGRLRGDAKWNGVTSGRMFEQQYRGLSGMDRDLKGKAWGEALAEYAVAHPRIEGTDRDRPLIDALAAAVRAWSSSYDTQRDRCTFDPITFELIDR